MFGRLLGWKTKYTLSRLFPHDGVLPRAKFTLRPSLAFSYERDCTPLQQQTSAKLCGVAQAMELRNSRRGRHLYIPLGGHHVGHRPTFLVSSFFQPILSHRRLNVYHTPTHGVALVRI